MQIRPPSILSQDQLATIDRTGDLLDEKYTHVLVAADNDAGGFRVIELLIDITLVKYIDPQLELSLVEL